MMTFTNQEKDGFWNILGKVENAGIQQQFLLFPQCFRPYQSQIFYVQNLFICHLKTISLLSPNAFDFQKVQNGVLW